MKILTEEQSKALNLNRHISLTANAGSGKTFVLSKRFIEIALLPDISLRNICAITFTEKAASELYKKISNEIEQRLAVETDIKVKSKLNYIRRQLVSANISTIHSFCINILREHPVESGIDANFTSIDQNTSEELIELSIQESFNELLNQPGEENLKYLIRIFSSKDILQKELTFLITNRKNVLSIREKIYSKSQNEIANHFKNVFEQKVSLIFLKDMAKIIEAVTKINSEVLNIKSDNKIALNVNAILNRLNKEKSFEIISVMLQTLLNTITTTKNEISKRGYLTDRGGLENEVCLVEAFAEEYCRLDFGDSNNINIELARFGRILLEVFDKCLAIYSTKKYEQGFLDFEDILLLTKNILENASVQENLSEKFKFIMVDEYQDTNEIQYNIFLPLVDNLRKNNLFVVGDEKQSIYMFRDAELEVFNRTKNDIKKQSGDESLLTLPHSFRMAPEIAAFTNELFKRLFRSPDINFNEVSYNEIICAREEQIKGTIEILFAQKSEDKPELISQAELLKRKLFQLSKHKEFRWGDCAVLVRKRKSFQELEDVFREANIPFTILGGKGFYQQQIVYDIYNYFSFMLDQKNDTALVGLLRSPFFLLPDSIIFEINNCEGYFFYDKLKKFSHINSTVQKAISKLDAIIKLVYNYSVPEILYKIITDSYFLSIINARNNGEQEIANLKKLINLSLEFHAKGFTTIYDYLNFLDDKIETGADESQAALNDESNSVKILTIHQAKGLEFPNVFLFKCEETTNRNIVKAKAVTFSKEFGIIAKLYPDENYFAEPIAPPIAGLNNIIIERKNIAELKRLFYVAVTRAMNRLFICCDDCTKKKSTFIGLLQGAFGSIENEEMIHIESELRKIVLNDNLLDTKIINMKLNIPILREIDAEDALILNIDQSIKTNYEFNIGQISGEAKGEIISATKMLTFKECPFKYYLKYEIGYDKILQFSNEVNYHDKNTGHQNLDEKMDELVSFNPDNGINRHTLKGKIIHRILQMDIAPEASANKINEIIESEVGIVDSSESFTKEIQNDLELYFSSEAYDEFKNYSESKNEFEVFLKETDYFLNGIIDKIIFLKDRVIIVDYKTDNITIENVQIRAEHYFNQLKFYFYIVSGLFNNYDSYELRLIFLKHPDQKLLLSLNKDDRLNIGQEIKSLLNAIKLRSYFKNKTHCKNCIFSNGVNQCIQD